MKRLFPRILVGCLVAACVQAASVASAVSELVTNGGFETGSFYGWTQSGDTGFTSVGSADPHTGSYAAHFGPVGTLGFISQDLATTPGATYELTYWLKNTGSGTGTAFQLSIGGNTVRDETDLPSFGYLESKALFTAASSTTALQFGFREDPSYFYLDDVSVVEKNAPVPEPGTIALLGLGLVGVAGVARRRMKK